MDGDTQSTPKATSEVDPWQEYLRWARKFVEWDGWDDEERDYKLEIGEHLVAARSAISGGHPEWFKLLERAIARKYNNLITWQASDDILKWCQNSPENAHSTLQIVWDENRSVHDRFNRFADAVRNQGLKGYIAEVSGLHMAMGPTEYPVFRADPVTKSYKLTGYADDNSNLGARYERYLAFLDEMLERADAAGIKLRDRLDAQSVIWSIQSKELLPDSTDEERAEFDRFRGQSVKKRVTGRGPAITGPNVDTANGDSAAAERMLATKTAGYAPPTFDDIAARITSAGLRISTRTLRRYHLSLTTRGFVILAGVSGTGKTWLAEAYADAVGAEHRLISVAPNWTTNEDLLGFYNPVSEHYHDTPFSTFLRSAAKAWHTDGSRAQPYHLILDEMNLARVEYYFASFLSEMEVRVRYGIATIDIGGSDKLELTPNLYVTGTVNIDETTHGFADKVWDRAQLVELDLSREQIAAHLSGAPYAVDVLSIWDAVRTVGPFAFRVVDDIARYVEGADAIGMPWEEALDEQILQKVLPKLKGANPDVVPALEQLAEILNDRYPLSYDRAQQMLEGIRQYGFASYFG